MEKVSGTNRVARKSPVRKGKGEASRIWNGCCWLLKAVVFVLGLILKAVMLVRGSEMGRGGLCYVKSPIPFIKEQRRANEAKNLFVPLLYGSGSLGR